MPFLLLVCVHPLYLEVASPQEGVWSFLHQRSGGHVQSADSWQICNCSPPCEVPLSHTSRYRVHGALEQQWVVALVSRTLACLIAAHIIIAAAR